MPNAILTDVELPDFGSPVAGRSTPPGWNGSARGSMTVASTHW